MKSKIVALLFIALCCMGCARSVTYAPHSVFPSTGYPVYIDNFDDGGSVHKVVFDNAPRKVIAIWQNSIETILALGAEDSIVAAIGVPDSSYIKPEYREAFNKIPIKSSTQLDLEQALALHPDFIVGWSSSFSPNVLKNTSFWDKRHINTYIAGNSVPSKTRRTLAREYQDIIDLGYIFNKSVRAQQLVAQMQAEIAFVQDNTAQYPKPSALIVELIGREIFVYSPTTLAYDILSNLGVAPPDVGNAISYEQLLTINPDVLFVVIVEEDYNHSEQIIDNLYNNIALQKMNCIQNKNIHAIPLYSVYSSGVRSYDGIKYFAKALYPNLYEGKQ